ncbi:phenylalanine--tRNA ligase subunit alpha [Candidatus Saccharibacteria bacterium]|nr:phenylalanine--tRNA ligase subunit alpha [Candidatus Saccharibacteria bacterium]
MGYENKQVRETAKLLHDEFQKLHDKKAILRSPRLSALYGHLKTLPAGEMRAAFGKEVNKLKADLEALVKKNNAVIIPLTPIDVTAPFDINLSPEQRPDLMTSKESSIHPLTREIEVILDIFGRMGFEAVESREIDDDYHMFGSLNFPLDHPARDDYDTFVTDEGLIAPAHTSTMQNRVLKERVNQLKKGKAIRAVIPGRVFRNEDLDARHEHTFYQLEGVYVDEGINAGHLIATLKVFLEEYYGQKLKVKTQPFYFPFTEPSFEFALSCPFCKGEGCHICSQSGWIELLGCGMIHPNVLKAGGVNPQKYTGFAWGGGIDRLVMMKYGVEDVRHFHSGNLKFLRQFS